MSLQSCTVTSHEYLITNNKIVFDLKEKKEKEAHIKNSFFIVYSIVKIKRKKRN